MPLIFHELGHNIAGKEAGSSIDVFLKEGPFSKQNLRKMGKLPPLEEKNNPYFRALKNRDSWILDRERVLKDNPKLLKVSLDEEAKNSRFLAGAALFYEPNSPANREENIFFGYSTLPHKSKDWIAIEVEKSVHLHDSSCRDRQDIKSWFSTSVSIDEYDKSVIQNGSLPRLWKGRYNEYLIRDFLPPEKIVAYAKVEKELPIEGLEITNEQLSQIQNFIGDNLSFATQFENLTDNALLYQNKENLQIRVSFNKDKIFSDNNGEKVQKFFNQFTSLDQLLEASNQNRKEEYEIKPSSSPNQVSASEPLVLNSLKQIS